MNFVIYQQIANTHVPIQRKASAGKHNRHSLGVRACIMGFKKSDMKDVVDQ